MCEFSYFDNEHNLRWKSDFTGVFGNFNCVVSRVSDCALNRNVSQLLCVVFLLFCNFIKTNIVKRPVLWLVLWYSHIVNLRSFARLAKRIPSHQLVMLSPVHSRHVESIRFILVHCELAPTAGSNYTSSKRYDCYKLW